MKILISNDDGINSLGIYALAKSLKIVDKVIEIEADLFREYSMSMRDGGIMNINDMLTPIGYKEGPPKGMTVGDIEKMAEQLMGEAMRSDEAKRIAEYDPNNPE